MRTIILILTFGLSVAGLGQFTSAPSITITGLTTKPGQYPFVVRESIALLINRTGCVTLEQNDVARYNRGEPIRDVKLRLFRNGILTVLSVDQKSLWTMEVMDYDVYEIHRPIRNLGYLNGSTLILKQPKAAQPGAAQPATKPADNVPQKDQPSCEAKERTAVSRDCDNPVLTTLRESAPAEPNIPEGFVLIPAGRFQMGDQSNPPVGEDDELPVHTVEVDAFYMAKHEVTKGLWDKVRKWGVAHGYADLVPQEYAGWASASGKADNHPVYEVTWWEVIEWCNARSEMAGLDPCYTVNGVVMKSGMTVPTVNWNASGYRLPTEAEWEKAARGGLIGQNFPWGNKIIYSKGNFNPHGEEADQTGATDRQPSYVVDDEPYTSPVGSFSPNGYGLYDMAGNVSEWCWDWGGDYSEGLQTRPKGPAAGWHRVVRGGGWHDVAAKNRVACRYMDDPDCSQIHIGFRVARSK